MQVHVKTPHISIDMSGEIPDHILTAIRKEYGELVNIEDDIVDPFESDWYKEVAEERTPGDALKLYRENAGMTQEELGTKLGSHSRQYVSDLENNRRSISKNMAKKLAELFDTSVERFI